MRSDWDDAPRRTRRRGKGSGHSWLAVGIAAITTALIFGYRGGIEDLGFELPWKSTAETTAIQHSISLSEAQAKTAALHQPPPPSKTPEEIFWEQEGARQQQSAGRQTSFSDANYTPSRSVNVISSARAAPAAAQRSSTPSARAQGPNGTGMARVVWQDARGRRTSWLTPYSYQDGTIDNASFCLSLGKGSIDYRNCRKGAQEWLRDKCRSGQDAPREWRTMYCHAHGGYRT